MENWLTTLSGPHNRPELQFLVDRHKHRIVKRGDVWCFYCPIKGPDEIIYSVNFLLAIDLLYYPCPHWPMVQGWTKSDG